MRDDEFVELRGFAREIRPGYEPAQTPAGHAITLGKRVHDYDRFLHAGLAEDRWRNPAVEVKPLIYFVREEPQTMLSVATQPRGLEGDV